MARLRYVSNVFGERREIRRRWESGHVACPFCDSPFKPPQRCGNPACDANPSTPRVVAEERNARHAQQEAQRIERLRVATIQSVYR